MFLALIGFISSYALNIRIRFCGKLVNHIKNEWFVPNIACSQIIYGLSDWIERHNNFAEKISSINNA